MSQFLADFVKKSSFQIFLDFRIMDQILIVPLTPPNIF